MSKWQPMHRAPQDGTPILAWDGKDQMVVEYVQRDDGSALWRIGRGEPGVTYSAMHVLLRWMPLPDPPEDAA